MYVDHIVLRRYCSRQYFIIYNAVCENSPLICFNSKHICYKAL